MKRFCVLNLGCKVNRVESDLFESILYAHEYHPSSLDVADIIIVNTCTVTGEAEKKARKLVRHAVRSNAFAPIVVTGCASAISPEVFEAMSERISVVGKAQIEEYLLQRFEDGNTQRADSPYCDERQDSYLPARSRVGVKIQDGCDNECSYCIVCKARGASVSTDHTRVEARVKHLTKQGIKEILLTGIDLGAYRDGEVDLVELLKRLLAGDSVVQASSPLPRFRISSIEPTSITDALIEVLARSEGRICRHLHIPLQSGSDRVLTEMNRHYGAQNYVDLIASIRRAVPTISITTDVIVGFPGETDEDFKATKEIAQACGFSNIHVFPYSMRAGTHAASRSDQVDPDVKNARAKELRQVARKLRRADARSRIGTHEWYCIQEDGMMMSESYYEVEALPAAPVGDLIEAAFVYPATMHDYC